MSEQSDKILTEAMTLPTEERARVAAELIASVDGEPDAEADPAWAKEIDRRGLGLALRQQAASV